MRANQLLHSPMANWIPEPVNWDTTNFEGLVPESWCCIDCGMNTAPGCLNRIETENAIKALGKLWEMNGASLPTQTIDNRSEVYTVREAVWRKAGVEPMGGCLCIGCLEKRIGRRLKPKDFLRDHPFNQFPGTSRLLQRRK
jgi:hypothetical protein